MTAVPSIVWLLLWSGATLAESLTVIHDSGKTQPLAPYLTENIQTVDASTPEGMTHPATDGITEATQAKLKTPPITVFPLRFPISTPGLRPGRVKARALSLPHFSTPVFLIGSDDISQRWLRNTADKLKALGAVGVLVQADTAADWQRIKRVGQGLDIQAMSGQVIAESLGLRFYPVLISNAGIEQ